MTLSDAWVIVLTLALSLYIVLDGYDLGIGVLTLFERDPQHRRAMFELVSWVWDGNESWLVLLGLAVWGGLPLAYGIALPALYIPLALMLWSLIARGVALEMLDQHPGWHRGWGRLFGVASLMAGFCQGVAFGGLVAGVSVRNRAYAGGPLSFLHHGYAILTGTTAVALYLLAAAAWIHIRSEGPLQHFAARAGRRVIIVVAGGAAASWALLSPAGSTILRPGDTDRLAVWLPGAAVLTGGLWFAYRSFDSHSTSGRRSPAAPALGTLAVYAGGLAMAFGLLYPHVVPPLITVHEAASPRSSTLFLLIGVGMFVPIVLAYQTFAYWVFRGKLQTPMSSPS